MAFDKKTWVDRNVEHPARRKLTAVSGEENTYDVVRAEGIITEVGDAFNAETMNDLEDRIADAMDLIATTLKCTLSTTWTQDSTNGYYYQNVGVVGIKSTDAPALDVVTSGNASNIKSQLREWSKILRAETYDGGIKFYAKSATTVSITVVIKPDLSKVTVNNVSSEEAGLDKMRADINTNTNNITANTSQISTNTANIASVKSGNFNISGTAVTLTITES